MARHSVVLTLVVLAAALVPSSAAHIPTSADSPLSTLPDPYACSGPTPVGLSVCAGGSSLSWYRTTVEVGSVGQFTSIALDASGNPAIAYYAQQTADVKLATRDDSGAWTLQTVDSAGSVGRGTSLAFTPQGAPVITYFDNTNGALKSAEKANGTWTFQVVASGTTLAGVTSLAVEPDGTRTVAWITTAGALMVASSSGASWSVVPLATKASGLVSLALDGSGEPAIAFGRAPVVAWQNEMWYVAREGGVWTAPVKIESGGRFGAYASLRFTSAGLPIIAYSDMSSSSMNGWTAKLAEFDGTGWTNRSLAAHGVDSGYFLALTLDANDCPGITYWRHTTGGLVNTRSDCQTWITQTIDRGGSAYWYTSAVSDAMGRPMIATWENAVGNVNGLRFATLGIDTCYPSQIAPIALASPPASCDVHVHEPGEP